jgi:excisionase family DNA binding protein
MHGMSDSIILQNVSQEDLERLIKLGVAAEIEKLRKDLVNHKEIDELLTRKEAYEYLRIDSSTLWTWTNKGKVKAYAIGNRRYYKRSELIGALKPVLNAKYLGATIL